MTVSNTTVKTSSAGNGSLSSFAIGSITFSDNADLDVYIRDETSSPATESLKTITTHYYITDSAGNQVNPGTHIKFDTGAGHTLPITDQHVVVKRKIELTQSTDYSSGDAFPADSHEDALDRLTLQVQQLQEQLDRNSAFPETYTVPGSIDTTMPEPEANGILKWNATATALVMDTDLVNSTYKMYASNTSDTTAGFLNDKLIHGTGLSKSALTTATNQTVTLSVDLKTSTDLNENSATHAASQRSIKAYVDAVTTSLNLQDLDFSGDSGGAQNVDLDTQSLTVEGGTGIDTTGSAQKISVAIDSTVTTNSGTQTLTNKRLNSPKLNEDVAVTATATEVNILDGVTATTSELNIMDGVTSTASELNILDGVTASTSELNIMDGVTASTSEINVLDGATAGTNVASKALVVDSNKKINELIQDYGEFKHQGSDPANATAANDVRLYAKSSKLYTKDNSGTVTELGAGGGVGSIDTLFTIQAKSADAPNTGEGNDAVFLGGGTLSNGDVTQHTTAANLIGSEKVFKYDTTGNSVRNYWYHEETINSGYAGKNMVLQLQYYTRNGGDGESFRFVARDGTKPIITVTSDGSNAITGTVDATVANVAEVGDRIVFKDSSNNIYYRYITSVTNNSGGNGYTATHSVTYGYSGADQTATGKVITGVMTDELDYLPANDTTGNEAKTYRKQMSFSANCTTLQFGFHCLDTDTDVELYYDDIALSANQFLQTSSQLKSSKAMYQSSSGYGSDSSNKIFKFTNELSNDIPSSVATLDNNSASGFSLTANAKIKVDATLSFNMATAGTYAGWSLNASSVTTILPSLTQSEQVGMAQSMSTNGYNSVTTSIIMEKGDILRPHSDGSSLASGAADRQTMQIVVAPVESDVVLLNSQDEIFTDWVSYTPTISGWSTAANIDFKWRRNGSNMEIIGYFSFGTANAAAAIVDLPAGYSADANVLNNKKDFLGMWYRHNASSTYVQNDYMGPLVYQSTDTNGIYWAKQASMDVSFGPCDANSIFGNDESCSLRATIPIQGWSSTFNPVLSMPLVDVGANVESYLINGWTGRASSNDSYYSTNTPNVNTINKLGSITNSSGGGFGFTASQRVKVDFSFGSMSSLYQYVAITKTSAPIDPTSASGDNKKIVTGKVTTDNDIESVSASCVLESGESLWISIQDNGTLVTDNYAGSASIVATKDYSHTNMAHIIKPAVAIGKIQLPTNTEGGTSANDGYNQRKFNTWYGETWFVSGFDGTLGTNGTTDQFDLDPGMYKVSGSTISYQADASFSLMDSTDSSVIIEGLRCYPSDGVAATADNPFAGVFTITEKKTFKIWTYTYSPETTYGLGIQANQGTRPEVYGQVIIEKLK